MLGEKVQIKIVLNGNEINQLRALVTSIDAEAETVLSELQKLNFPKRYKRTLEILKEELDYLTRNVGKLNSRKPHTYHYEKGLLGSITQLLAAVDEIAFQLYNHDIRVIYPKFKPFLGHILDLNKLFKDILDRVIQEGVGFIQFTESLDNNINKLERNFSQLGGN